jgi:hypothetical protein
MVWNSIQSEADDVAVLRRTVTRIACDASAWRSELRVADSSALRDDRTSNIVFAEALSQATASASR